MKVSRTFLIFLVIASGAIAHGQESLVDSLKATLVHLGEDTVKVNTLNKIADLISRHEMEDAIVYGTEAKHLAENLNFRPGLATAYKNIGLGYYFKGDFVNAFKNWEPALELYQAMGDDKGIANMFNNQGGILQTMGKNTEAIEYFIKAMKIAEKYDDKNRIATLLLNIGLVYSELPGSLDLARSYYLRGMKLGEAIGYGTLIGVGSVNLGEIYFKQQNYDSALYYYEKSLTYFTGNVDIAASLTYIGRIYTAKRDFQTAIKYHEDALKLATGEDAQVETASILLDLGNTYKEMGNPRRAIGYYQQAIAVAEEVGLNEQLSEAYGGISYTYSQVSDYPNAFKYLSLKTNIDNLLYQKEADDKAKNLMFSYQLEKKQGEIEILERESVIEQLRVKRQKAITIATGVFGLLILLLAVGFYNRMRFIRRTNEKINAQKDEIESQRNRIQEQRDQIQHQHDMVFSQKEMITDSISYAQRIQSALLPSPALMDDLMPEHFIFFRPKDIVSGDFYWVREVKDHLVLVGADCTGHGVPGAFMSMLGITLLNDLIGNNCYNEPSAILERLRKKIKDLLVQEGNVEEQKDGMDMVIAVVDKKTKKLYFSGANNPLYLVRNKHRINGQPVNPYLAMEDEKHLLLELKGDKQPIGIHWEETDFSTHVIKLQEHDTIYIFSDGFVDQYGGENRKKFKSLNFKKLLLSMQQESMDKQGKIIEETFETWRGEFEQIDDVSVMGVRI